jgi:hypothetical protein
MELKRRLLEESLLRLTERAEVIARRGSAVGGAVPAGRQGQDL